jgi:ribonuclease HII
MRPILKTNYSKDKIEAGVDEAGRGCLAGPVFAAAVILPLGYSNPKLNDSKKLSESQRMNLREEIINSASFFSIQQASHVEIDTLNILQATYLAMHRAIHNLAQCPELLLIDGNRFKPYKNIDFKCIIKGDSLFQSIAAASILAKTERDLFMIELDKQFPQYDWINNKGYGTKKHVRAIEKIGLSPYHRKSFHLKNQLKLEL